MLPQAVFHEEQSGKFVPDISDILPVFPEIFQESSFGFLLEL